MKVEVTESELQAISAIMRAVDLRDGPMRDLADEVRRELFERLGAAEARAELAGRGEGGVPRG